MESKYLYLHLFIYLTETVYINSISENMPELARMLIYICSPQAGNSEKAQTLKHENTINDKSNENMQI